MFKKIAITAALALLSSAAVAADQPSFYAGGDLGRTDFNDADSETSLGAFGGYQFNARYAVELSYRRLADVSEYGYEGKMSQTSISGIASMPLSDRFGLFGRLGVSHLSIESSYPGGSYKSSENKALFGAGLSYAITPAVAARLEVQKIQGGVTNLSTGISFRF